MRAVPAYSAPGPGADLVRTAIHRREPGDRDVVVEIEFCGICHTDIHMARDDWGGSRFPLTPGHEIVGRVQHVGSSVTAYAIGDRVGVGCLVGACLACESCSRGLEQYCEDGKVLTYNGVDADGTITQGGYSTHIVVDQHFVVRVPESLDPAAAAPLLCAGITTYSPLRHWGVREGTKVAVVGVGGLGHLALQFASAMGAEVTAISQSRAKESDARRFGATRFVATSEEGALEALRGQFDLIINTVSSPLDLDGLLLALRVDGTFVNLGAPAKPLPVNALNLLRGRRSVAGSTIGSLAETQEMLDFCAENGITSEVEIIGVDEVNEAFDRVLASAVRYRFVIDVSSSFV